MEEDTEEARGYLIVLPELVIHRLFDHPLHLRAQVPWLVQAVLSHCCGRGGQGEHADDGQDAISSSCHLASFTTATATSRLSSDCSV